MIKRDPILCPAEPVARDRSMAMPMVPSLGSLGSLGTMTVAHWKPAGPDGPLQATQCTAATPAGATASVDEEEGGEAGWLVPPQLAVTDANKSAPARIAILPSRRSISLRDYRRDVCSTVQG